MGVKNLGFPALTTAGSSTDVREVTPEAARCAGLLSSLIPISASVTTSLWSTKIDNQHEGCRDQKWRSARSRFHMRKLSIAGIWRSKEL
jgi:hypothetical protein